MFNFKERSYLFLAGFKNGTKGLLSLYIALILWGVVFGGGFGYSLFSTADLYTKTKIAFWNLEGLKDGLITFLLFFSFTLLYCSQQFFINNNLLKVEGEIDKDQNLFVYFLIKTSFLLKTAFFYTFIFAGTFYSLRYISGSVLKKFGSGENFISNLFTFDGILNAILILSILIWFYCSLLALNLIYLSITNEKKHRFFIAKYFEALKRVNDIFKDFYISLSGHIIITIVLLMLANLLYNTIYGIYYNFYITGRDLDRVVVAGLENKLGFYTNIMVIPTFILFQTYFLRVRMRTLALILFAYEEKTNKNNLMSINKK